MDVDLPLKLDTGPSSGAGNVDDKTQKESETEEISTLKVETDEIRERLSEATKAFVDLYDRAASLKNSNQKRTRVDNCDECASRKQNESEVEFLRRQKRMLSELTIKTYGNLDFLQKVITDDLKKKKKELNENDKVDSELPRTPVGVIPEEETVRRVPLAEGEKVPKDGYHWRSGGGKKQLNPDGTKQRYWKCKTDKHCPAKRRINFRGKTPVEVIYVDEEKHTHPRPGAAAVAPPPPPPSTANDLQLTGPSPPPPASQPSASHQLSVPPSEPPSSTTTTYNQHHHHLQPASQPSSSHQLSLPPSEEPSSSTATTYNQHHHHIQPASQPSSSRQLSLPPSEPSSTTTTTYNQLTPPSYHQLTVAQPLPPPPPPASQPSLYNHGTD